MTPEALYLALVLAAALVLFYTGWLRIDVTALLVMLALILPWRRAEDGTLRGILDVSEGFSGFGSPAVIMVASMFVLSAAMVRTGAAPLIGERLLAAGARSVGTLQLTVLVVVTLFSSVINDTTTVLVWMPLVLDICRKRRFPYARLLLPLAYASLLGGQWTLIGTRSNIIVSDFLRSHTGEGLDFFAFTPVAAVILLVSMAWFLFFGRRLLPAGEPDESLAARYEVTEYLSEVMATPDSQLIGRTLAELSFFERHDVHVLQVIRGHEYLPPTPWLKVTDGDVFVIQGKVSKITALREEPGLKFKEELALGDRTLKSVDLMMVEAVVAPHSELEGRSLEELDFPQRYGLSVLAVGRRGHVLRGRPQSQRLQFGDSLLLVAHQREIDRLRNDPNLVLVESRHMPFVGKTKALLVLGLLVLVAATSAAGLLEPAFVIPAAAVAAVLTRCISLRHAYEAVDWRTVVVIGGMIPYGLALEKTDSAGHLAGAVIATFPDLGPRALLAGLLIGVIFLTQVIDNAAVAIIVAPVAFRLALVAGADPMPFLLATGICISAAFMTPVAHESTILVMGPGGYTFRDYLRGGAPLALITWLGAVFVLPLFYPLVPEG